MSAESPSVLVCSSGQRFEFSGGVTIGRSPVNDLVIDLPRVSGRHASIDWEGGEWRVRDLGSHNGTSVNRRRVKAPKRLREGDVVRFAGASAWTVERLCAGIGQGRWASTERLDREAPDQLQLYLAFVGPDEGTIRIVGSGQDWSATMRQRFVLLWLLGRAGGAWVQDEELKRGLWGRGSTQVDPSALHKLIFDVRRLLGQHCSGAGLVVKNRRRTRLALPAERIHLSEGP
jgi:hypothetical protein